MLDPAVVHLSDWRVYMQKEDADLWQFFYKVDLIKWSIVERVSETNVLLQTQRTMCYPVHVDRVYYQPTTQVSDVVQKGEKLVASHLWVKTQGRDIRVNHLSVLYNLLQNCLITSPPESIGHMCMSKYPQWYLYMVKKKIDCGKLIFLLTYQFLCCGQDLVVGNWVAGLYQTVLNICLCQVLQQDSELTH